MHRAFLTSLILVAMLVALGCGGDEDSSSSKPKTKTSATDKEARDEACSAGDGHLQVSDVLDKAPPGLEIIDADREKLRPIMDPLRKALGDRLRGFETKVVAKRGTIEGTAIIITNANESIGTPEAVLEGAQRSAKDNDGKFEEITVADNPAAFVDFGEVKQISVQLGDCAAATLIDHDAERLRTVADALHQPS